MRAPASAVIALLAALALAPSSQAAGVPGTISISPSRTVAAAVTGRAYGPITLRNSTEDPLLVQVIPVLLRQDLNGAVLVRSDRAALRQARRAIRPQVTTFELAPGRSRSVQALLRRVPRQGSFYGGLLFASQPAGSGSAKQQIRQVFRINGSLYLDPARSRADIDYAGASPMRAEQAGERVLRIVTPVVNRGNWALPVRGEVTVTDSAGRVRFRRRVKSPDVILPRATVELPARLAQPVLPAGNYRLRGVWRARNFRFVTTGAMRLFGPNTVATRDAKVVRVAFGNAYIDEPVEVTTTFRNTGNVRFGPRAVVTLRPIGNRGAGKVFSRKDLVADAVGAGKSGEVQVRLDTPRGDGAYQVDVRLYDGKRLLDSGTASTTPSTKPSLIDRITQWIKDNAVLLVLLLLLLLLATVAYAAWRSRRRGDDEPAAAVAPPPPVPDLEPTSAPVAPPAPPVAAPPAAPPPAPAAPQPAPQPAPAVPATAITNGGVDINTATVDQLMTLPGIGRRAAERIVEHREANGPFGALDELSAVEGFHSERIRRIAADARV